MKTRLSFLLLLLALPLLGKEVPVDQTKQVAISFLLQHDAGNLKGASMIELQLLPPAIPDPFDRSGKKSAEDNETLLYVFSIDQEDHISIQKFIVQ
jgi:hypothetical protein